MFDSSDSIANHNDGIHRTKRSYIYSLRQFQPHHFRIISLSLDIFKINNY